MTDHIKIFRVAAFACIAVFSSAAQAKNCVVRDGVIADVTAGPFLPVSETVTLKDTYVAEFRWNGYDRESIGWMRIVAPDGRVVGWVPAGHEGIKCGEDN